MYICSVLRENLPLNKGYLLDRKTHYEIVANPIFATEFSSEEDLKVWLENNFWTHSAEECYLPIIRIKEEETEEWLKFCTSPSIERGIIYKNLELSRPYHGESREEVLEWFIRAA